MPVVAASGSPLASWSAASISTVMPIVSTGAPQIRWASAAPMAVCAGASRGRSVRVTESGLYWKMTMRASGLLGSTARIAPPRVRGLPGKLPMGSCS